ncbi:MULTISPECIES: 2-C-methyl-D-erythritol 4-phosphate cytidylyltransferase [unclassified Microbacterium]|uniref:2-C-methyl-D-erythritol 4-phosphate cytidylyltransferase n=1 Tax=unclassified Microbacterium TaxID=2609290 RepID=UPI00097F3F91|nr:2-C-methyl-D-erythritol 4-phosphate cytidylyltransferase [Microbacterium sp. JB110]RCS61459.1 2-C-methyl-D-erythritol 4-phosphate cytidylyltransferase [Microbacterium sp. JB110]SJM65629.1 2-C-methyl-D-erythritol 2,4-cyclodiphosphate synthase [Frigoribacterium sp. JB110]
MTELSSPRVAVIVVAAGSGTRLGADAPKAFVGLDEHTMLRHALDGVFALPEPCQVIVVAPAERTGEALTEAEQAAGGAVELVSVVAGGATRHASVQSGLKRVLPAVEIVLVHDAARALTPADVFTRVIEKIRETGWGAMPVLPVIDTIKRVDGERVSGAVDRSQLGAAQTPQGFRRDILESSYAVVSQEHTDDAAVVMEAGHPVAAVEGHAHSFKITTPADLERARTLVVSGDADGVAGAPVTDRTATSGTVLAPRVGIGTDVHAYGGDGDLWLAGLEWPGERALSGHSDGDVVAHAIVDALLSAAGLGDIGAHFGVDRPEFAGAHGEAFLAETLRIIRAEGFEIGNVAVQLQASKPKFAPRRAEAERALSAALDGAAVSVSATTTDGLGFTAADGVQAFATALLIRS